MTKKVNKCQHEAFNGAVNVNRIADQNPIQFIVELKIWCDICKKRFYFSGDSSYSREKMILLHELAESDKTEEVQSFRTN